MQATTHDVLKLIDKEAPFDFAEDWDNSGLQSGNMSWPVNKILIALDPSIDVMKEAAKVNADLVLTHHPLFIKSPNSIDFSHMPGNVIAISAREKISIISAHTNLDKAKNGLNDYFAEIIGLHNILPLSDDDSNSCFGRKGLLEKAISLKEFAMNIKENLNLKYLRIIGDNKLKINSATVITGSGGSLIENFFQSGTDVFITGDVKYHEARSVEERNLGMIDVGHFGSESIAIELLAEKLINAKNEEDYGFEIFKYENEIDPFNIV